MTIYNHIYIYCLCLTKSLDFMGCQIKVMAFPNALIYPQISLLPLCILMNPHMTNSYANASCMTDVFVGGKKHKRGTDYLAEDATIEVSDGWYFIKAMGSVIWKSTLHSPKLIWKQEEPQYG